MHNERGKRGDDSRKRKWKGDGVIVVHIWPAALPSLSQNAAVVEKDGDGLGDSVQDQRVGAKAVKASAEPGRATVRGAMAPVVPERSHSLKREERGMFAKTNVNQRDKREY